MYFRCNCLHANPRTANPRPIATMLVPERVREFLRCHVLRPLLRLLRGGVTPRRLAWSLAIGMAIGINPTVGIATVLVILVAWIFGLSQVASQIGMHVVAPLHLLLFIPFLQLGVYVFRTRHLPFSAHQIKHLSHHPVLMARELWMWQWHALVIWGAIAVVLTPLLAIYLRRALVVMIRRHRTLLQSRQATH